MAEVDESKVIAEPDGSNDETDKSDDNTSSLHDRLTGEDYPSEPSNRNMELESPSSELENLASQQNEESDSGDSMASGREGSYDVNATQDTESNKNNNEVKGNVSEAKGMKDGRASLEPAEKKSKVEKELPDGGLKLNDSRPGSVASSGGKSSTPGKDKDPARKEKDKEREERIRLAQQKLAEERQKKIEELREQQRMAQENREKQLEARRNKIEELKRREEERRKQVEERRKTQEEIDKAKKEAILNKAKERLTRYEQWKAHGRKGYPGESPPSKQLSMSMSALYGKRSPDFSSTGNINKVGTGNLRSGAESLMALNTIPENRLRRSLPASAPPSRHKSAVNVATSGITGVKMRDPSKTSPRKQRPYSVATSMPSFVAMDSETPRPSRSKSTDRGIRDRSKTRTPGRKEDEKTDGKDKKSATLPRPYDRTKIEERRLEAEKKREERKEREKEREKAREKERMERMSKSETTHEKEKFPTSKPLSKSFMERMATPKHPSPDKKEHGDKESSPVKSSTSKVKAKPQRDTPTRSPSKSNLKDTKAGGDGSKSDSPKSVSPVPAKTPQPKVTPIIQVEEVTNGDQAENTVPTSEPLVKFSVPEIPDSPQKSKPEPKQASPEPKAQKAETSTPKTDKEREMEEYKNKLAEKRRLAREKAEREAEIERIRQEELRRQEEEREREEEEQQRRDEEEALRLAEELRKIEEERLAKAIEAEEKRKREEAERLEQERLQKEEADRKAKEEAERLEKERQEKVRKEEEEKIERRKRLDDVLKRFKTDSPASTPTSTPEKTTRNESPTRVPTTSSSGRNSLVSSEDEKGDDSEKEEKSTDRIKVNEEPPKFKSPLLQKLTEGKSSEGDSGTPKFKSPLLQSIMGKTKLGARLSSTKLDEIGRSTEKLSTSTDRLSDDEKVSTDKGEEESQTSSSVVNGHSQKEVAVEDTSRVVHSDNGDTDKQEDRPDPSTVELNTDVEQDNEQDVGHNGHPPGEGRLEDTVIDSSCSDTPVNIGGDENGQESVTDSPVIVGSTADSAVSLSFNGVSPQNGDMHIVPKELIESKELVDSSISMRTADSFASSQTWSIGESLVESQNLPTSDSTQFEEVIDLNSHLNNKTLKAQQVAENFLINHNLNDNDDITMSDSSESPTHSVRQPIIAFEDNATRRQDVPDLLS